MSRIGKQPVALPSGVEIKINQENIEVKGPMGTISTPRHEAVVYKVEGSEVVITRVDDSKSARAQHGLRRALLANCVDGVSKGWNKVLEFNGVGYRVAKIVLCNAAGLFCIAYQNGFSLKGESGNEFAG